MTHSAHASDLLNHDGGPRPGTEGIRFGFFTDTSVCIGCKACEVACKEWNQVPQRESSGFTGTSMDNTGELGADSWRHVAFIEQPAPAIPAHGEPHRAGLEWFGEDPGLPPGAHGANPGGSAAAHGADVAGHGSAGGHTADVADVTDPDANLGPIPAFNGVAAAPGQHDFRWLMSSDVCKHCTEPACLEVCPTGAIFFTEFDTVVVQDEICNGCGYCVTACPYGVIERRSPGQPGGGGAFKCTLCYDRLKGHQQPACAKACPTDSIQFGPLEELRERAADRVEELQSVGLASAQLYGADPNDGVGGNGAFFLLLDEPEVYGLPPDPVTPTRQLGSIWRAVGAAAAGLAVAVVSSVATGRRS